MTASRLHRSFTSGGFSPPCKALKGEIERGCSPSFGSPRPNAGEGPGGEGETSMPRPEPLDQNKANIPSLISRAQELRHSDTLAEKLAWKLLRNRHVLHYKFRRQVANLSFKCGAQTPRKVPSTVAQMTLAVALLLLLESTQTPFSSSCLS